jgi:hypothetical protein
MDYLLGLFSSSTIFQVRARWITSILLMARSRFNTRTRDNSPEAPSLIRSRHRRKYGNVHIDVHKHPFTDCSKATNETECKYTLFLNYRAVIGLVHVLDTLSSSSTMTYVVLCSGYVLPIKDDLENYLYVPVLWL